MRELIFRGISKKDCNWVKGGYMKHLSIMPSPFGNDFSEKDILHFIIKSGFADWNMPRPLEFIEVVPETVGQFSDSYDSSFKPLFEGDIVEREIIEGWKSEPIRGVVVFYNGGFKLKYHLYGSDRYDDIVPFTYQQYESNCSKEIETYKYTLLGNTYDNKNLLEET